MTAGHPAKETLTVLCVEDDPATRKLLTRMLERRFQRVLAARDGEEGLELFLQHRPALVLTDVQMPRMDGISMARAIKLQDREARMIILTSLEDTRSLLAAIEVGVTDYLVKPVTQPRLDDALDRCLRMFALESRLRSAKSDLSSILDSIADTFFALDPDWRFTYVNASARSHLGRSGPDLLGRTYWSLFPDPTPASLVYQEAMQTGELRTIQINTDGAGLWHEHRVFPLGGGISVYVRDVSAEKRSQEEIHFLAFYDKLTDLPNRTLLQDRLATAITRCRRDSLKGALMFLDLDRFKNINDSLGHDVGDLVLREAATRLKACVRESDTVARLGGDEFIVLLDGIENSGHIPMVAKRILGALSEEIQIREFPLSISASLGVALIPGDGERPEDLLKAADTAMYFSKGKGGNAFHFYQPEMNIQAQSHLFLEGALRKAIYAKNFKLHYQPQFDLRSRVPIGVEALARWELPDLGVISPTEFIPLAEETGLILPLGEWVLETACRQARAWQMSHDLPLRMAVNVSGRQFWQGDLVGTVERVLAETGLRPDLLELEITETMIMHDVDKAIARMTRLASMGVRLSIDDFGTGYSSMASLHKFPIHALKIDQSFIRALSRDPDDGAIPVAILALARSMRLEVVAEGIEREEQLAFLVQEGCRLGQGYLLGHPMAPEELAGALFAS